jgi:hypothetical protein
MIQSFTKRSSARPGCGKRVADQALAEMTRDFAAARVIWNVTQILLEAF